MQAPNQKSGTSKQSRQQQQGTEGKWCVNISFVSRFFLLSLWEGCSRVCCADTPCQSCCTCTEPRTSALGEHQGQRGHSQDGWPRLQPKDICCVPGIFHKALLMHGDKTQYLSLLTVFGKKINVPNKYLERGTRL